MNSKFILFWTIFIFETYVYAQTILPVKVPNSISCYDCLNSKQANQISESFMCLNSWDSENGSCCKAPRKGQPISPFCKKGKSSLCSARSNNSGKYAYCPFDTKKCISKPMISASKNIK